jgi:Cof subfamily protein (haloacid dehalogenase superfamily)
MVVTDLDGTLLKTDKTVSEYTQSVLTRCRENGIKVVFATARGGSGERLVPAHLVDGKIRMNGAIAKIGDKIVYDCKIPYMIARPLLIACDRRGLKIVAESCDENYSVHHVNEQMYKSSNDVHQKLVDISQHKNDKEKIFMTDITPKDEYFITSQIPAELYFLMAREGNGFGMIMHKNATKAKAVSALADIWGIEQADIVAFGDDLNDIDMLRYVGVGVAMGNALDDVKKIASCVCDTNDNDGVAKWLEKRVL